MSHQAGEPGGKGSTGRLFLEGKPEGTGGAGLCFWRQSQGAKQAGELTALSKEPAAKVQGCRAGGPEATRIPPCLAAPACLSMVGEPSPSSCGEVLPLTG